MFDIIFPIFYVMNDKSVIYFLEYKKVDLVPSQVVIENCPVLGGGF